MARRRGPPSKARGPRSATQPGGFEIEWSGRAGAFLGSGGGHVAGHPAGGLASRYDGKRGSEPSKVEAMRMALQPEVAKPIGVHAMRSLIRFLRFILQVQGAVVLGAEIVPEEDKIRIRIRRRKNATARCPKCKRSMTGQLSEREREWRHLDILARRTYLVATVREGYCSVHGRRVERVPWAAPKAKHTRVFDHQVACLVQVADKSAAERMFGVAWRTVSRIVSRVVNEHLPKGRFANLRYIGVDETSYKRGHRYLTIVTDLLTRRVIWVGEGKNADTLMGFFDELGERRCRKLEMIAMDMSGAFRKAVGERVPHVDLVFDRFHVVKLLLEAVDGIRRDEVRKLENAEAKKALKKTRFPLLRNPKRHLSPRDREAIARVKATNKRLARAYELRCDLEELWEIHDPEQARQFLMNWTRAALRSRLEPLRRFATTARKHLEGILGFFRWHGQTSGVCEGMNNKIKLAIHRAFGFRSVEALASMVFLCCGDIDLGFGIS